MQAQPSSFVRFAVQDGVQIAGWYTCAMDPIHAIYEAGVFRPLKPVNLAEGTRAEVIPVPDAKSPEQPTAWPPAYFEQTAGAFECEDLIRHPQGEFEVREPIE
jgi:hypothetical protein